MEFVVRKRNLFRGIESKRKKMEWKEWKAYSALALSYESGVCALWCVCLINMHISSITALCVCICIGASHTLAEHSSTVQLRVDVLVRRLCCPYASHQLQTSPKKHRTIDTIQKVSAHVHFVCMLPSLLHSVIIHISVPLVFVFVSRALLLHFSFAMVYTERSTRFFLCQTNNRSREKVT